jgi:hypothetical protein
MGDNCGWVNMSVAVALETEIRHLVHVLFDLIRGDYSPITAKLWTGRPLTKSNFVARCIPRRWPV